MRVDLDKLEQLARAAMPGPGVVPGDEEHAWWLEGEDVVEGFEGEVARCRSYDVADYIAAMPPPVTLDLIGRVRAAEAPGQGSIGSVPMTAATAEKIQRWAQDQAVSLRLQQLEAIVRDLAAREPVGSIGYENTDCTVCPPTGTDLQRINHTYHYAECPYRRAREATK